MPSSYMFAGVALIAASASAALITLEDLPLFVVGAPLGAVLILHGRLKRKRRGRR